MLDLDMSPYAAFVWSAWGISALTLAALVVRAAVVSRRWKRELDRLEREDSGARSQATRSTGPQAARSEIGPKE